MNRIVLFLLAGLAATPAGARADTGVPAPVTAGNYELRGFFGRGDSLEVSIRLGRTDTSVWVRIGERFGNLLVVAADPDEGTALIEAGGIRSLLRLERETTVEKHRRT